LGAGIKRKKYPQDLRTVSGLSMMGFTTVVAQAFMSSLFMLYLTDYAGINGMVSAAGLGTGVLLIGRLFDAINDPLQGWLIDNTKLDKTGRYKKYIILSTILVTISVIFLYSLPEAITQNTVLSAIWIIFFYIIYDVGTSFYVDDALKQTMSPETFIRTDLISWPRVAALLATIPFSFLFLIVQNINAYISNMHRSFTFAAILVMIPVSLVSLFGASLVDEGKIRSREVRDPKVSFRDILIMFKMNKPLRIVQTANIFGGFIWTLVISTAVYYIKWSFCFDELTRTVDSEKFAVYTMILGIFQILPLIIGTVLSAFLIKKTDNPLRIMRPAYSIMAIIGLVTYILNAFGILPKSPVLYFITLGSLLFGNGLAFVPGNILGMECMDYAILKTGKMVNGIINNLGNLINKAQVALASAGVGLVLIITGYNVDSTKDAFLGAPYAVDNMLNSLIVISGLIPFILAVITLSIYQLYPIGRRQRKQLKEDIWIIAKRDTN